MLKQANIGGIPDDISKFDFSTEQEKALGKLVRYVFCAPCLQADSLCMLLAVAWDGCEPHITLRRCTYGTCG